MKKNCYVLVGCLFMLLFVRQQISAQVVINELGIAPTCASCDAAGGGEFIELYNKGCSTVNIGCDIILFAGLSAGGNPEGWSITIPSGTTLAPCAYYVIGGSGKSANPGVGVWANVAVGGNPWNNPLAASVNLDISSSSNTSMGGTAPGNLVDKQGEIWLLSSAGAILSSVSYNIGNFTSSNDFPGMSNGGTAGCGSLASIAALTDAPMNVNGTWNTTTGSHSLNLTAAGTYVISATQTPGTANPVADGGQMSCSAGGPTALGTTPVNASCGNNNGSVTIGATTGGTAPYSYNFNSLGFSTTTVYSNLAAGTYTVVVKDANGCTFTTTATVSGNPGPTALATTPTNANCGGSTGSVVIGATTGGTGPFTYNFNSLGFSSTTSYTGLVSGTYTVVVKDANGCTYSTTATVGNNPGPTALATTPTNTSCGGNTGSVSIGSTTGGTGPFTYNFNSLGFSSTTSYTNLPAGTYTVIVKDANGCTYSTTATVGNNPGPTALATTPTNTSCGSSTGSVTIGATTGGTGPFTYNFNSLGYSSTTLYSGLAAGTYTVLVKDANGCIFSTTATVGNNSGPTALASTPTNASCGASNGSVSIGSTTGGTGPYTYNFNSLGFSSTTTYNGLPAGTYSVIVKDANGCTFTTSVTINNNGGPTAQAITPAPATCGSANGSVNLGGTTGGTGPYTYNFNSLGFSSTTSYTGIAAGTYTVVVKDVNGCTYSTTVTVPNSTGPSVTASSGNAALCNAACNGSANVTVTGGTGALTYSWSPSGGNAATTPASLCAGSYTCTVKDSNGCVTTKIVTLTDPPAIVVSTASTRPATCNISNGAAIVSVTGGTGAYTYSWAGGGGSTDSISAVAAGSYSVTVTDANNCPQTYTVSINNSGGPSATLSASGNVNCNGACNGTATVTASGGTGAYTYAWSPSGGTSATASSLCAGSYTCSIRDANNCLITQAVTITQPAALSAPLPAVTNIVCNGGNNGSATVTPGGGTSPYTFSWSPVTGNTATVTNLGPGIVYCLVTDANGCSVKDSATITQPAALSASLTSTQATCATQNGTAAVTAGGGTGTYTYAWSPSGGSSSSASGLAPGLYTCTVTDANGCTLNDTVTIANVGNPPVATVLASGPLTFCQGSSVTLHASGGTTYSWSNGSTLDSIVVAASGTFTVTVTNSCGTSSAVTTVTVNPLPVAVLTGASKVCQGDSILLTASGGTSYTWSTGSNSASIYVTAGGTYSVIVTNGCGTATAQTTVTLNSVTSHFTADSTTGYAPFNVNFTSNGSANAITWTWSFGDGATGSGQNPSHVYPTAGTYTATCTATDANGCSNTYQIVITVLDLPSWIYVPNVFTPNGDGKNDVYLIGSQGLTEFDMKIYDRWGVELAEIHNAGEGWDGRTKAGLLAADGTYYYVLHAVGTDKKIYDKQGFFQLIH
ncbi:MAG: gliding motility-associated C-terminal domain-containing protein [Bacteroidia bacterium]